MTGRKLSASTVTHGRNATSLALSRKKLIVDRSDVIFRNKKSESAATAEGGVNTAGELVRT